MSRIYKHSHNPALILYKNNIQQMLRKEIERLKANALILYKNNIQLFLGSSQMDTKQALILYKNNIQQLCDY